MSSYEIKMQKNIYIPNNFVLIKFVGICHQVYDDKCGDTLYKLKRN